MDKLKKTLSLITPVLLSAVLFSLIDAAYMKAAGAPTGPESSLTALPGFYIAAALLLAAAGFVTYAVIRGRIKGDPGPVPFITGATTGGFIFLLFFSWLYRQFSPGIFSITSAALFLVSLTSAALLFSVIFFTRRRMAVVWSVMAGLCVLLVMFVIPAGAPEEVEKSIPGSAAGDRTNLLFILIDTLRADHLSCYGYGRETSPFMDKIAAGGVRYAGVCAQSSHTKPSTASIFTSLYPSQHDTNLMNEKLPGEIETLAEHLSRRGYRCYAFSANGYVSPEFGFDAGFDYFYLPHKATLFNASLLLRLYRKAYEYLGMPLSLYAGAGGDMDRSINENIYDLFREGADGPFFIYIHYISPHHPYDPPEPFEGSFGPGRANHPPYPPGKDGTVFDKADPLNKEERKKLINAYDGEIHYVDDLVSQLFEFLKTRGMMDDTLVVLTSDHGEEFYEHANWDHAHTVYGESVHVPLILNHENLPAGSVVEEPVELVDVLPSLSVLLDFDITAPVMGKPFIGERETGDPRYSELIKRRYHVTGFQKGPYKYIKSRLGNGTMEELYNMDEDREEKNNLADSRPVVLEKMRKETEMYRKKLEAVKLESESARMSPETKKQLRALGYLN